MSISSNQNNTNKREENCRERNHILAEKNLKNIISAQKYYVGNPDGKFITRGEFDEETVNETKAYETINTLLGDDTAELVRFIEGKKQTPGLISAIGLQKICDMMKLFVIFANSGETIKKQTVRVCRQNEITETEEGMFDVIKAPKSSTKSSIKEIMSLGYGDKSKLAICRYHFRPKVFAIDMERFGKEYLKPEEKEVLILIGNKYQCKCAGYSNKFFGKDNKPALMYDIYLYPPDPFGEQIDRPIEEIKRFVFNRDKIVEVKKFFEKLNSDIGGSFPEEPVWYRKWREAFKIYLYSELDKIV